MEEYKKIIKKALVPSFFIMTAILSVILSGYASLHSNSISFAVGVIPIGLGFILLPLIYSNSMKISSNSGWSRFNIARIIVLLTIAAAASIIVLNKINTLNEASFPALENSTYIGTVKKVISRRYTNEILIKFFDARLADRLNKKKKSHMGIAYVQDDILEAGDKIVFDGKASNINYSDQALSSFKLSLLRKGIGYIFNPGRENITILNSMPGIKQNARKWITKNCNRFFKPETSSVIRALYFGNKNCISKSTLIKFKRAGVLHVLAASGLHVGIIASIPVMLLGLFRINKKLILLITMTILCIYLYLTDMPVSLMRACIMFFIYSLQTIFDLEKNIFNTLFLSASIILLIDPHEIFAPGFQLSFGATFGIILFYDIYRNSLSYLPKMLSSPISLALSAQLFVMPIILYHMSELNLVGIASNIIAVPLIALLLIVSIVTNILSIPLYEMTIIGIAADIIYTVNKFFVEFMAGLGGHFHIERISPVLIGAFLLLTLPLFPYPKKRKLFSISIIAAYAAAWIFLETYRPSADTGKEKRYQIGNATVAREGKNTLISGNISGIDNAVKILKDINTMPDNNIEIHITNPDWKNISAYSYIVKRAIVTKCYLPPGFRFSGQVKRFFHILDTDGIKLIISNPHIKRSGTP